MSLTLRVGALANLIDFELPTTGLRAELRRVNNLLRASKLPEHKEPEVLPPVVSRAPTMTIPYDWLHRLRRVYAHVSTNPAWVWTPSASAHDDPAVIDASLMMDTHLLCHSDCEGFYVPLDFTDVPAGDVAGGLLGSSQRLRAELVRVAPKLGIQLVDGALGDDEIKRLAQDTVSPMYPERMAWLALFEAARLSIEHGAVVQFE